MKIPSEYSTELSVFFLKYKILKEKKKSLQLELQKLRLLNLPAPVATITGKDNMSVAAPTHVANIFQLMQSPPYHKKIAWPQCSTPVFTMV